MPQIHPMAVVETGAQLAADVTVGPFAYIGPNVVLGSGCMVHHHASIQGHTVAGKNNHFFPGSVIGGPPQDLKYRGSDCQVTIGNDNRFRELVTVNMGTEDGGGITQIGNGNLLMANVHIAHDCFVRNRCIFANNVMLAGHIEVEDGAVLSGAVAVTHFVSIGQYSFIGGVAVVVHDVPPFLTVDGRPASIRGLNRVGLRRRGYDEKQIEPIKDAYRLLYRKEVAFSVGAEELEKLYPGNSDINTMLTFIRRSREGKYGRYRESLRGKTPWLEGQ
ncbi:MAG: acyl-ACP--UDP-N-acetylglucosamine O-acyltransferase [Phycisphaerae bacterium]